MIYKKKNKFLINEKKGLETKEAIILECLPSNTYKVKLKNSKKPIIGYLSGNMYRNHINLLKDDIVIVELSKLDHSRCRIVFRK